jgi:hypothetical protein
MAIMHQTHLTEIRYGRSLQSCFEGEAQFGPKEGLDAHVRSTLKETGMTPPQQDAATIA